jgi:GNAT superfamily N-acetyltransferase
MTDQPLRNETVVLVDPATLVPAELLALYEAVGWTAYLRDPESLRRALANSHRVAAAFVDGRLVGTARTISDGESIIYLQDVLIHPDHQRRGLGRRLIAVLFDSYEGFVGQRVLLTDSEPGQRAFYEAVGMTEVHDIDPPLRAFWQLAEP